MQASLLILAKWSPLQFHLSCIAEQGKAAALVG